MSPRRQRLGLYYQLYFDNIGQQEVCMCLRELLRHLRGRVIVLLDNSSTHQRRPSQASKPGSLHSFVKTIVLAKQG